jgi:hypothetical protein
LYLQERAFVIPTRPSFRIVGPAGQEITSLDAWLEYAAPKKREKHWRPRRSAMESARAWLDDRRGPVVPAEIAELLDSHRSTRAFRPELATPELVTRLDAFGGEHRNHDLVVVGDAKGGRTLVAIEAKADESFGDHTVAGYLDVCAKHDKDYPARVEAAQLAGKRLPRPSNARARIEQLCAALFGPAPANKPVAMVAKPLRYQLVTALAGALIEAQARNCAQAVLVVHEFLSDADPGRGLEGTSEAKVRRNEAAWRQFVAALGGDKRDDRGALNGPLQVPGGPRVPGSVTFLLGKAIRRLES